jgi:GNAT superfamily N-acetyltransferase
MRLHAIISSLFKPHMVEIERLTLPTFDEAVPALSDILHACVHNGASVGFILQFSVDDARTFWLKKVRPGVEAGTRRVLLARREGAVAGTVQLVTDTPSNQPHRAEIAKLLVHPSQRRHGIGRVLMNRVEAEAVALGRSLLTLDTRTGDHAEPLYASLGYVVSGIIPLYCLDVGGQRLDATTIMYKQLA